MPKRHEIACWNFSFYVYSLWELIYRGAPFKGILAQIGHISNKVHKSSQMFNKVKVFVFLWTSLIGTNILKSFWTKFMNKFICQGALKWQNWPKTYENFKVDICKQFILKFKILYRVLDTRLKLFKNSGGVLHLNVKCNELKL